MVKYGHRISEKTEPGPAGIGNPVRADAARSADLGRVANRGERMHRFDDLAEVESVIERMAELVVKLPVGRERKRPASRTCCAALPLLPKKRPRKRPLRFPRATASERSETEVAQLRLEIEDLKQQFAGFQKTI